MGEREGRDKREKEKRGRGELKSGREGGRVKGWGDPTGWDSVVTKWSGRTLGGATVFLMEGGAEAGNPE